MFNQVHFLDKDIVTEVCEVGISLILLRRNSTMLPVHAVVYFKNPSILARIAPMERISTVYGCKAVATGTHFSYLAPRLLRQCVSISFFLAGQRLHLELGTLPPLVR